MKGQWVARQCAVIAVQLSGRASNNVPFAGYVSDPQQILQ